MSEAAGPTLADDQAALAGHAHVLTTAIEHVVVPWLTRLIEAHAPGATADPQVAAATQSVSADVITQVRSLLQRDIADQTIGPLELLRQAVAFPTAVLAQADVAAVTRDEFSRTNFPDDIYDLTPASFAAIDPSLHEPGLMWGAAKAHVHLRRRREMEVSPAPAQDAAPAGPAVVALSVDLMDRSKLTGALPDAKIVRSVAKLVELAPNSELVLVDLNRLDDVAALREIVVATTARVVAFGSHVDEAQLHAATETGAEALPRSVFFRRLEMGELKP